MAPPEPLQSVVEMHSSGHAVKSSSEAATVHNQILYNVYYSEPLWALKIKVTQ